MLKNEAIGPLLELHQVDSEIDKSKSQRDLLPLSLRRLETRLARHREAIEEKKARIKELRAQMHAKEVILRSAEEDLNKLSRQIKRIRTNKEYTAIQHEITAKKVDSSRIEDHVLAVMADTEDLQGEVRELEQGVTQIQREQTEESALVNQEIAKLNERIAGLQGERAKAASQVDDKLLEEYERIAAKKGSSAIAAVVTQTCQGCFMQIPTHLDHTLQGGKTLVHCPNCNRILYLP